MTPANNTQFAPSPSGYMHVGHLWLAMLCRAVADAQGGRFILAFDDLTAPAFVGASQVAKISDDTRRLLEAVQCEPDVVCWCSRERPVLEGFLQSRGLALAEAALPVRLFQPLAGGWHDYSELQVKHVAYYAVSDYLHGVNPLIEGADLAPLMGLYLAFCGQLGLPTPEVHLLPRVSVNAVVAAKSHSAAPASHYLEQLGPEALCEAIRRGCLREWDGPLALANVNPTGANVVL